MLTGYVHCMSITTLARSLGQDLTSRVIHLVFIQQKRPTIIKKMHFQNEKPLQPLLQYSVKMLTTSVSRSSLIYGEHQICILVSFCSSLSHSAFPHVESQEFSLDIPEMDCIAAGKNPSPEICKMHTLLHDHTQHIHKSAMFSPLFHLIH